MSKNSARWVAGVMTGTSLDGLDAALVEISGTGLEQTVRFVKGISRSLGDCAAPLRALAEQQPMTAGEIARVAHAFSILHRDTLHEISGHQKLDLICVHGQTVFHAPPFSWQLLNPAPIVAALNTPVVYDLRAADLAHGGQGAPITPLADYILFRGPETRAVVNLGGFCNLTRLPASSKPPSDAVRLIQGGDICACNQLLDGGARELLLRPYDPHGQYAASGTVLDSALADLLRSLNAQKNKRASLGTGDELQEWFKRHRTAGSAEDLLRTLCAGIAEVIVKACEPAEKIVLAGGGTRNQTLVKELKTRSSRPVELSDAFGIPADFREAAEFAVLGALCQDGVPITLPQVTGVKTPPLSGCWMYPTR
jgi:1,6-anhydro-N-acetylmuramate kinase